MIGWPRPELRMAKTCAFFMLEVSLVVSHHKHELFTNNTNFKQMKKLLLLMIALLTLGAGGAWADVTVTVHDQGTVGYTTYGSLSTTTISNDTYTTSAASGIDGLKLTNSALAWNRAGQSTYYLLQGVYSSGEETTNVTTITAPEGYLITGYSMEACGWNANRTFTATAADGTTSITVNNTTTQTLAVSDLKVKSTTITVVGASTENTDNNWFSIKNFTVTLAKIDYVSLTFDKPGSATNNITVNVKDADGDAIPGVTATLESTSCTELKTGSATALSRTTNSVLAPNAGYANAQGSTITYTFKVEGLPTTFTYNNAALDVYALTGGGAAQGNTGNTVREWTFDVATGSAADAVTSFVNQAGNDICTVTDQDGDLYHKLWTMTGTDKAATDALYIVVTLTKTASLGCYAGLGEVQLYKPGATVKYVISDEGGNVVFTSDFVNTTEGDVVTELPTAYKRDLCSYSAINQTMVAGENTVNVTVTYDLPFTLSQESDFENATWYTINLGDNENNYLYSNGTTTSNPFTKGAKNLSDNRCQWAFFGNPYDNIYIMNRNDGAGNYMQCMTPSAMMTSLNEDWGRWQITEDGEGFIMRLPVRTYWFADNTNFWVTNSDGAATIYVEEVTEEDIYDAVIAALETFNYGSAIGLYRLTGDYSSYTSQAATIIDGFKTKGYSANDLSLAQGMLAATSLNTPSAGYYRLKNVTSGQYLNAKVLTAWSSTTRGVYADGDGNNAATIIKLYDTEGNGTLYMYNQSYGFGWTDASKTYGGGVAWITSSPDKYVHWFPGNTAGQIAFAICLGNGVGNYSSYLTKGIYTVDTEDNAVIGGTDYTSNAAQWIVEEASEVTIPLNYDGSAYSYGTMYLPFGVTLDGATAYTLTVSGEWAIPSAISAVPAGTPVLLRAEGNVTSVTATIDDGATEETTGNELVGTYLDITTDRTPGEYILGMVDGTVGFYQRGSGRKIGANKAYLNLGADLGSAAVKGIRWDLADGINGLTPASASAKSEIYNLAGQRMSKLQRGVNIVGGKKVLVK